jgi:hypothetical protein
MTITALVVALAVFIGLSVMQILIISGRPIGEYAWGGQHRVATPRLRLLAVVAIALYVGFSLLLMSRSGVLAGGSTRVVVVATWALFAYCALSIALNAASRSRRERIVQTPVSVLLTLSVLVVAMGPVG